MLIKKKVFYNLIVRNNETEIDECINSILGQKGIIPYISISCLDSSDTSFFLAKRFCKNPIEYNTNYVIAPNICVFKANNEKSCVTNGLIFSKDKECEYYCFMHIPGKLDPSYSLKCLELIKNEVVGAYSNEIDSGAKVYNSIVNDKEINLGSFFMVKKSIAGMFNHDYMGDFLKGIVNIGVYKHIPEFLVETKWRESVLKQEAALNRAV